MGETENLEIITPFKSPQRTLIVMAKTTAMRMVTKLPAFSTSKNCPVRTIAVTRLERFAIATMDKSMPPRSMQSAIPKANTATSDN